MKAPVHSTKHYDQTSLSTVANGANVLIPIAKSVALQNVTSAAEDVVEGCVIKAVYVEMWCRATSTEGAVLMTLVKEPLNVTMSFTQQTSLNNYENKKNILYHTQGLTNDTNNSAIPFIRQWFKIPKSKQRFGLGDKLALYVAAQALQQTICGFTIFKEYT